MNKILFIILVSLSIHAYAQKSNSNLKTTYLVGQKVKGYVVTTAGDTLMGQIKVRDKRIRQYKVSFYPTKDSKKVIYEPSMLKSYAFGDNLERFYKTGYSELLDDVIFMHLKIDGCVKVYEITRMNDSTTFFKMKDQEMVNVRTWFLGFKKKASSYFANYKMLADDIKKGKYKTGDLDEMVNIYNEWCKQN